MIRTNVMLTDDQHTTLKQMAKTMHRTLGELVRDAVETAYPKDVVGRRRTVALAAYQEGLVSLGRLADTIGLDPVSTRTYCATHGVRLLTQDASEVVTDAANA